MLTESHKINYIYKKILGKPTTLIEEHSLQEPNVIFGNNIHSHLNIFANQTFLRDSIPYNVPTSLESTNFDDDNNNIIGSKIGKSDSTNTIKKFIKLPMYYIPGSKLMDSNNNITSLWVKILSCEIKLNKQVKHSCKHKLKTFCLQLQGLTKALIFSKRNILKNLV